ncbi:phosphoadenosine phosphosulfate reductase [Effusibacillus dendaii]|uniref:Adenosine 5'-phosphosulfate reductase n=1 Tax=Effusibacillus dendaii TaxID=2743772 RepID=A0A7I8DDE1_9BACL|nr:phosphoadenosine phosphosulfate reductase [Effusibacillus dendaii]
MEERKLALQPEEIHELNSELEDRSPQEILEYAVNKIEKIAFACSFGAEDVVIVDMLSRIKPDTSVFYLDTDVLFPETYDVRNRMVEKYNLNLIAYRPLLTLEKQAEQYGESLWQVDPNQCCSLRKVEPLQRALCELDAWITGIRREQAPTRANAGVVEIDRKFGLIKWNPLAKWTNKQVWDYIIAHQVPYNVLHDKGYPSIGCIHCTRAVKPGEDLRAGRWSNFEKTECGLHQ